MKVLYGIQGTGNGHVSRAKELLPELKKHAEVDVLISGRECDIKGRIETNYSLAGLSFTFGRDGGVDMLDSVMSAQPIQLLKDIFNLPVEEYDLVVNDFEPVSAWAARARGVPVVALSHQAALLSEQAPRPKNQNAFAEALIRHYAPCDRAVGVHFDHYDTFIEKPVIQRCIRNLKLSEENHVLVYLPAYDDKALCNFFASIKQTHWHVFAKRCQKAYSHQNVTVHPISQESFLDCLAKAKGVVSGAGFELPSEVLFLGKRLCVIPMKSQYEQHCNAAAVEKMGVLVLPALETVQLYALERWLSSAPIDYPNFPDNTELLVERALYDRSRQPKSNTDNFIMPERPTPLAA